MKSGNEMIQLILLTIYYLKRVPGTVPLLYTVQKGAIALFLIKMGKLLHGEFPLSKKSNAFVFSTVIFRTCLRRLDASAKAEARPTLQVSSSSGAPFLLADAKTMISHKTA